MEQVFRSVHIKMIQAFVFLKNLSIFSLKKKTHKNKVRLEGSVKSNYYLGGHTENASEQELQSCH